VARFVGERREPQQALVHFDGRQLTTVYTYIPYASGNTFNNPATLLVDADGVEHVLRTPEKAEKASVRDYSVGESLSDPVEAIAADRDGRPLLVMVNVEHAIVGITNAAVARGGEAFRVNSGFSTDSPMAFFMKP